MDTVDQLYRILRPQSSLLAFFHAEEKAQATAALELESRRWVKENCEPTHRKKLPRPVKLWPLGKLNINGHRMLSLATQYSSGLYGYRIFNRGKLFKEKAESTTALRDRHHTRCPIWSFGN